MQIVDQLRHRRLRGSTIGSTVSTVSTIGPIHCTIGSIGYIGSIRSIGSTVSTVSPIGSPVSSGVCDSRGGAACEGGKERVARRHVGGLRETPPERQTATAARRKAKKRASSARASWRRLAAHCGMNTAGSKQRSSSAYTAWGKRGNRAYGAARTAERDVAARARLDAVCARVPRESYRWSRARRGP